MPQNPWLAIDAATPPGLRAREVRRKWERFVGEGVVNGLRAPVVDSWRRSRDAGVTPAGGSWSAPVAAERDEAFARWEAHPLRDAAPLIRDCLAGVADESEHLIVLSDAAGVLLQLEGNARVRSLAADSMNFTEGALWSEDGSGTNAIGTAVAADHAVQIFAAEHFVEVVQAWTCSAAPVHDPDTAELLGVVDLTGLQKSAHPHSLAIAMAAAHAAEGHLRRRLHERDERLRARYLRRITGQAERRALVAATGRLVADDSRGWLRGARLAVPPGGGELVLPSGERAVAEPLGHHEGYLLRELGRRRARRHRPRDELRMLADEHDASLVITKVTRTRRSVRMDRHDYSTASGAINGYLRRVVNRSTVASPIVVDDRLWGAVVVSRNGEPLPADSEHRMANFSELVGLVIANAERRAELTVSRARVMAAADEARRRIQRDLHDGAQQRLVST